MQRWKTGVRKEIHGGSRIVTVGVGHPKKMPKWRELYVSHQFLVMRIRSIYQEPIKDL